jgi:hypothetical protein
MARKTIGNGSSTRSKKTAALVQPSEAETVPEVHKEVRKAGSPANQGPEHLPVDLLAVNLEEEIRRRAYELYLQRRATAGADGGNQNQDWLIAEREIRSRYGEHQAA